MSYFHLKNLMDKLDGQLLHRKYTLHTLQYYRSLRIHTCILELRRILVTQGVQLMLDEQLNDGWICQSTWAVRRKITTSEYLL